MRVLTLAALICGPTGLAAQELSFDGVWRSGPLAECGLEDVAGGEPSTIRITGDVLHGVEMECRMTKPVEVRDMAAVLYDMDCAGDDDTTFVERAMFLKAADGGLYLVWDGYAFKYEACEAAPPVATADSAGATDAPE